MGWRMPSLMTMCRCSQQFSEHGVVAVFLPRRGVSQIASLAIRSSKLNLRPRFLPKDMIGGGFSPRPCNPFLPHKACAGRGAGGGATRRHKDHPCSP